MKQSASIEKLIPSNITSFYSVGNLEQAANFYNSDLPNPDLLDEEFHLWKSRWLSVPREDRPQIRSDTMKQCSPTSLPNIHTLLKLYATLPLSPCYCERLASALRRLNTYLRCTQIEERQSALALIHCNYNDIDYICKLFIQKYP